MTISRRGFTLVEVLVALLITATAIMALLGSRQQAMADTARARMLRTSWELAQWKIGEIGLDRINWGEGGSGGQGVFNDLPFAKGYSYEYSATVQDVPTNDPANANELPKKVYRLRVTVRSPDADLPPVILFTDLPFGEVPK